MRRWTFIVILFGAWCCLSLTGCAAIMGILNSLMGTTPQTAQDPPIKQVINFLQTIPGIGTALAAGLGVTRWGWVEYHHAQLVKEGKKDDNNDGVDDALQAPATPKPPAPTT